MTLFLYETIPSQEQQADPSALIDAIGAALTGAGAEVIETQITKGAARIFTIVELADGPDGACGILQTKDSWLPASRLRIQKQS